MKPRPNTVLTVDDIDRSADQHAKTCPGGFQYIDTVPEDYDVVGDLLWVKSYVLFCRACHWTSVPFLNNSIVV